MTHEVFDLRAENETEWLPAAVANHPFPPLWWVPGVSAQSKSNLLSEGLRNAVSDSQRSLVGCARNGEVVGLFELRFMAWDSAHYGFPIHRLDNFAVWGDPTSRAADARVLAAAAVARAREQGAKAVHTWLPMEAIRSIQVMEALGFQTMDILTTWVFEHGKQKLPDYPDKCAIRGSQAGDEEVFVPIAREAYTDTPDRFHSDPHLPTERSNELYAEWIRNSFNYRLADHIVVAEIDGRPAGYTTLKLEGDHHGQSNVKTGGLILSAVAPWAEGKGVYTSMINGGLRWFESQGVQVSHLGTQVNNYPVERAWTRLGFRLAKAGPSLHLWLGD